jgi:uncharacterized protein
MMSSNVHGYLRWLNERRARGAGDGGRAGGAVSGGGEWRDDGSIERRFTSSAVELRAPKAGKGPGTLAGHAAVFDAVSVDLGGFVERLAPGCFDGCLEDDCRCLRNHMDDVLLGRTVAGTLALRVDDVGLGFECDLPDTSAGWDTAELVNRRDISGCSFQFRIAPDGALWDFSSPVALRTITRVSRLYDVGPVTFAAYDATDVDMRSFERARTKALEARQAAEGLVIHTSLSLARARLRLTTG